MPIDAPDAPDGATSDVDAAASDAAEASATNDAASDSEASTTDAQVDGAVATCAPNLLVTTSDGTKTDVNWFDVATGAIRLGAVPLDDPDILPVRLGCSVGLLERTQGRLLVQSDTEPRATLHDIALDQQNTAYPIGVARLSATKAFVLADSGARRLLYVVDLTKDGLGAVTSTIDLSWLSSWAGGSFSLAGPVAFGGRVYVGIGRPGNSWIVEVDPATNWVVQTSPGVPQNIAVPGQLSGPMWLDQSSGRLWAVSDISLDEVDLGQGTSLGGVLSTGAAGGPIQAFVVVDASRALVLVGSNVYLANLLSGTASALPVITGVDGMVRIGGTVFVWSGSGPDAGSSGAGLRSFRLSDGVETTPGGAPLAFGTLPIAGAAPSP